MSLSPVKFLGGNKTKKCRRKSREEEESIITSRTIVPNFSKKKIKTRRDIGTCYHTLSIIDIVIDIV